MNRRKQSGFTLVEIAIVLVIVGLLLGAVLKGQELIFNSKVKATFNLSREISAAVYGYQDRYKQLPGDDSLAATRFPGAAPLPRNGNSDGYIAWGGDCRAGAQAGENCEALYHLRLAGFLTGTGTAGAPAPFGGTSSPASSAVFFPNSGSSPVLGLSPSGLTHKIMSAIDTSFDDGNPATGSVRCQSTASYNMSLPDSSMGVWCTLSM